MGLLDLAEELLAEEHDPAIATDAAQSQTVWGNIEHEAGNYEKGVELHNAAIVTLEKLEEDGTLEDLQLLDKILRSYGLIPEPRSKFKRAMNLLNIH